MSWPVFGSLRGYDRSWFRGDLVAGLTVALAITTGIAAVLAGLCASGSWPASSPSRCSRASSSGSP